LPGAGWGGAGAELGREEQALSPAELGGARLGAVPHPGGQPPTPPASKGAGGQSPTPPAPRGSGGSPPPVELAKKELFEGN
jgi:hypothetical protein